MKRLKTVAFAAALLAAGGAQAATVAGTQGGGGGSFLSLSSTGLGGGSVATLTGGTIYTTSTPNLALAPSSTDFGGTFLAVGTTSGTTAALSFAGSGVSYVSFLWGSPDTWNQLTVTTTGGVQTIFSASGLGLSTSGSGAGYVQFSALAGSLITGLSFTDSPDTNAFEVANFSVSPVPEPQTYALLAAGLGAVVFMSRRRPQ